MKWMECGDKQPRSRDRKNSPYRLHCTQYSGWLVGARTVTFKWHCLASKKANTNKPKQKQISAQWNYYNNSNNQRDCQENEKATREYTHQEGFFFSVPLSLARTIHKTWIDLNTSYERYLAEWSEYYKTCNKVICCGANLKMSEDPNSTVHIFPNITTYLLCLTALTFCATEPNVSFHLKFV